jgi:quinol monooxygenase YgiN
MDKLALLARLEAKPGKEKQVEDLLKSAQAIVEEERGTNVWYAFRLGPTTFGIFDTFADESGRQAHASGKVVDALNANADLFAKAPQIEKLDILATKAASSSNKAA